MRWGYPADTLPPGALLPSLPGKHNSSQESIMAATGGVHTGHLKIVGSHAVRCWLEMATWM